jgi:hypothetical protein
MAGFFPLSQNGVAERRRRAMQLQTPVGLVALEVWYGRDGRGGEWGCPIRHQWGLGAHARMSPGLLDRLAFIVTETGSFAAAAAVAQKVDLPADDSTLHQLTARLGQRAEGQLELELDGPRAEPPPRAGIGVTRQPADPLVVMLDAFQVRYRGEQWGAPPERGAAGRVDWHEMKIGVVYRHDQAGRTAGARGVLSEKSLVCFQGQPEEFGRRVHHQARERGLAQARSVEVCGDGAAWIWNLAADRFPEAVPCLDFYHASEHLWAAGRAHVGEEAPLLSDWVGSLRHELRHVDAEAVVECLNGIADDYALRGQSEPEALAKERQYFEGQRGRMRYAELSAKGWPIGSGAVESACRQKQVRFKRCGQFWTRPGAGHLAALMEARHNNRWDRMLLNN